MRDNDSTPDEAIETTFLENGGHVFTWRDGRALEDELFLSLSDDGVARLLDYAIKLQGEDLINDHITSASGNVSDLASIGAELLVDGFTPDIREILAKAAGGKRIHGSKR